MMIVYYDYLLYVLLGNMLEVNDYLLEIVLMGIYDMNYNCTFVCFDKNYRGLVIGYIYVYYKYNICIINYN